MMDFYVYVHRRTTDGKVFYVGKGCKRRAKEANGRNNYWRNTVSKHGYVVEIYADGLTEWYAYELERDLIAYHGRKDIGYGLLANRTDGGDGASATKVSEESRKRMSIAQKRNQTPERRAHMSRLLSGRRLTKEHAGKISKALTGKVVSDEWRKKHSETMRGRKISAEHVKALVEGCVKKASKKVICVDTGVVFGKIIDAEAWIRSIGRGGDVSKCLAGKNKRAGGFNWEYSDDGVCI
jgi:hypothetical protein